MARSNLVSVGSIVNPFESLQRSAQNVSATYGDIADKKDKVQREEQSRLDALARRKEDTAYRDQQAALAKTNADRSFGLQQKAEQRAQNKSELEQAEIDRKLGFRDITDNYKSDFTYKDLEKYSPDLVNKVSNAGGFDAIDKVAASADKLFDTKAETSLEDRITSYISSVENQRGKELTPQKRATMADALRKQLQPLSSGNVKDEYLEQYKNDVLGLLGVPQLIQSKQTFMERAPNALTKEEAVAFHSRRLMEQGLPRAQAVSEAQSIATSNNRMSYDTILEERSKAAEALREAQKEKAERVKDYAKLQLDIVDKLSGGKAAYKPSGSGYVADIKTLLKEGGVHENVDESELNSLMKRYENLVKDGFSTDIAMAATLRSFEPGIMFPGFGDEITPLSEAKQFALDLQSKVVNKTNANADVINTARENLKKSIKRDLLVPAGSTGAGMEAWKAGRWGDRLQAVLFGLNQ
jgi:hypothetical protein